MCKKKELLVERSSFDIFFLFPTPELPGSGTMGISQLVTNVKHPSKKDPTLTYEIIIPNLPCLISCINSGLSSRRIPHKGKIVYIILHLLLRNIPEIVIKGDWTSSLNKEEHK